MFSFYVLDSHTEINLKKTIKLAQDTFVINLVPYGFPLYSFYVSKMKKTNYQLLIQKMVKCITKSEKITEHDLNKVLENKFFENTYVYGKVSVHSPNENIPCIEILSYKSEFPEFNTFKYYYKNDFYKRKRNNYIFLGKKELCIKEKFENFVSCEKENKKTNVIFIVGCQMFSDACTPKSSHLLYVYSKKNFMFGFNVCCRIGQYYLDTYDIFKYLLGKSNYFLEKSSRNFNKTDFRNNFYRHIKKINHEKIHKVGNLFILCNSDIRFNKVRKLEYWSDCSHEKMDSFVDFDDFFVHFENFLTTYLENFLTTYLKNKSRFF